MTAFDTEQRVADLYFRAPDGQLLFWRRIPIVSSSWSEGFPIHLTVPVMRYEPRVGLPPDAPVPVVRIRFEPMCEDELGRRRLEVCGDPNFETYMAYVSDIKCD